MKRNRAKKKTLIRAEDVIVGNYITDTSITSCAMHWGFSGGPIGDGLLEFSTKDEQELTGDLWGLVCNYCFAFFVELPVSPHGGHACCPRCGSGSFHRDTLLPQAR